MCNLKVSHSTLHATLYKFGVINDRGFRWSSLISFPKHVLLGFVLFCWYHYLLPFYGDEFWKAEHGINSGGSSATDRTSERGEPLTSCPPSGRSWVALSLCFLFLSSFRAGGKGTWVLAVERGSALSLPVCETFGKLSNLLASTCVAHSDDSSVPASWMVVRSPWGGPYQTRCVPCHSGYHGHCFHWANQSWRWGVRFGTLKFYLSFFTPTQWLRYSRYISTL